MAGKTKGSNRRKFGRQPVSYPAKLIATDGSWGRNCRLIDASESGARLITEEPIELPQEFLLALSPKSARRCELRWIEEREVGVAFVREPEAG
jgi:PilZ domain